MIPSSQTIFCPDTRWYEYWSIRTPFSLTLWSRVGLGEGVMEEAVPVGKFYVSRTPGNPPPPLSLLPFTLQTHPAEIEGSESGKFQGQCKHGTRRSERIGQCGRFTPFKTTIEHLIKYNKKRQKEFKNVWHFVSVSKVIKRGAGIEMPSDNLFPWVHPSIRIRFLL